MMKNIIRNRISRFVRISAAAMIIGTTVFGMGGWQAYAEDSDTSDSSTFTDGTLTYSYLSGTEVAVSSCDTSATNVSIMPRIDGYDVVSISDEAFAECDSLQTLTIPYTVTEIGEAAFYGCTALTSLTIPDAVTEIEAGTFFYCSALTELNLGEGVTTIGDMAFGYCTSLTELTLPDSLESVGTQLFYYCISLEKVDIPESLTELGAYTFYGCMSMTEFNIPATLEEVGAMSFFGCQSLATISVEEGNEYYTVVDNVLYNTEQSILYLYPAGRTDTSFTIPDSVLVVYAGAFFYATNLEEVTFGEAVQYIGEMAFNFCYNLTSLTIPETVTFIGSTAFSDCTGLTQVIFEGADAEDGGEGEDLEIDSYAFFCCDNLKEVQLPKRVTSIGEYAFGVTSPDEEDASDDAITIETDSGESMLIESIAGFQLIGYTGVAKDYAKSCEVDVDFKALDFDWASFALYVGLIAAVLVVAFLAVRIVRHNMRSSAERAAAKEMEEKADDGYRGILDEDDTDVPMSAYEQTLPHSYVHQRGHAEEEQEDESKKDETEKNETDESGEITK